MPDLTTGIRFEDEDTLLIWGARMSSFLHDRTARYEDKGDRIIYHWGQHEILGGLRLDLHTLVWGKEDQIGASTFRSIEHWATGDDIASSELIRIKQHMLRVFGPPNKEQALADGEYGAEWQVDGAMIEIALFEQHTLKLHFVVRQEL